MAMTLGEWATAELGEIVGYRTVPHDDTSGSACNGEESGCVCWDDWDPDRYQDVHSAACRRFQCTECVWALMRGEEHLVEEPIFEREPRGLERGILASWLAHADALHAFPWTTREPND